MNKVITFNKTGYDPFIDFIKAYAIICVLIGHTLPVDKYGYGLWAGMQVPLFVLVQVFHFYKKDYTCIDLCKIAKRILIPFAVFGILLFIILAFTSRHGVKSLIVNGIANGGGYGPGSYYPCIYLQIALLLPCFRVVFKKLNTKQVFWFFLILAEVLEIICSFLQPPEWLYRILSIRYVFLIYLGWIWVKEGIKIDKKMIILSGISMLTIIYFENIAVNYSINNEPWFFNTLWYSHRWPCYFYVAFGLVFMLHFIWRHLRNTWVNKCISVLSKSSYEIFLMQMATICIVNALNLNMSSILKIALIWIISIIGGIGLSSIINKKSKEKSICIKK